jgi:hypothetical protein
MSSDHKWRLGGLRLAHVLLAQVVFHEQALDAVGIADE